MLFNQFEGKRDKDKNGDYCTVSHYTEVDVNVVVILRNKNNNQDFKSNVNDESTKLTGRVGKIVANNNNWKTGKMIIVA